ncbi:MAG: hypothetical protein KDD36_07755 [Flavobacteriales bacterium]|nr:hypothetical protein [Flavobacteriales bacterium]
MTMEKSVLVFLLGICVVLMLSVLVVVLFRNYIRNVIMDLNGDHERQARFWVAYSTILMILVPLIIALIFVPSQEAALSPFYHIVKQVKWSLIGLVMTIFVLGVSIHQLVPRATTEKDKNE